jgi:hypothetical protein
MTPEEKADYLIHSFSTWEGTYDFEYSVIHSKFCVNQIIDEINEIDSILSEGGILNKNLNYWQEVKNEIEKYD